MHIERIVVITGLIIESTNPDGSFDPDAFLKNLNSGHHKPGSMGGKNVNKFSSPPKKGGSMIFVDLLEPTDENRKGIHPIFLWL